MSSRNEGNGNNGRSEKRGRDRSEEPGPSSRPEKVARKTNLAPGRKDKKREEFFNQPKTRPEELNKSVASNDSNKIRLQANFFKFNQKKKISVTQYRLDFSPECEIFGLRRYLLGQHRALLGTFVYDGGNVIFLLSELQNDTITLESTSREGQQFQLSLKKTGTVFYTEAVFLQVLNLVFRNAQRGLDLQMIRRELYDAKAAIDVPQLRLQIWPGYNSSVRQHERDVLLCVDLKHKVMRNQNVLDIIMDCQRHSSNYQEAARKLIIGTTVLTRYNNKTYRINDIDFNQNPTKTFETKNGNISFLDYYRGLKSGPVNIRDTEQPLLVSKSSARNIRAGQSDQILLVPELCFATGLTDEMRSNFQNMRELAQFTRLKPMDRVERLMKLNQRLHGTEASKQVFRENHIELDKKLVEIDGRTLTLPTLTFGNSVNFQTDYKRSNWDQATQGVIYKEVLTEKLKGWNYVYPEKLSTEATKFLNKFMRVAAGCCDGRGIEEPKRNSMVDDRTSTYIQTLRGIRKSDTSFIMVIVPDKNKSDLYNAIKKEALCGDNPVSIQVVSKNILKSDERRLMTIATKVAIQVNCKLGGAPWMVDLVLPSVLIIGFSVTHDTSDKEHSYGAMVASMISRDSKVGSFYTVVSKHHSGVQISSDFGKNVAKCIKKYSEEYGCLPDRLLIYRDGVGDGQIQDVIEEELNDVKRLVEIIYTRAKRPKAPMAFIILNKRTNTRIFHRGNGNNPSNPPIGTVVDDVITLPERYDFYLISTQSNQGTVSPTYYNIIHDDFSIIKGTRRPGNMQLLTFKLCHLYYNWSGTTCIPSVVQYAKKLAILVGQHLHELPSNKIPIDKQLYFL